MWGQGWGWVIRVDRSSDPWYAAVQRRHACPGKFVCVAQRRWLWYRHDIRRQGSPPRWACSRSDAGQPSAAGHFYKRGENRARVQHDRGTMRVEPIRFLGMGVAFFPGLGSGTWYPRVDLGDPIFLKGRWKFCFACTGVYGLYNRLSKKT